MMKLMMMTSDDDDELVLIAVMIMMMVFLMLMVVVMIVVTSLLVKCGQKARKESLENTLANVFNVIGIVDTQVQPLCFFHKQRTVIRNYVTF